ncbi:hypothetical protein ACOMHN_033634 [Nucella lapillus]
MSKQTYQAGPSPPWLMVFDPSQSASDAAPLLTTATTGRYLPMTPPPLPPLEFLSPEALRDLLQQKMRELVGGSSSGQPRAVRSSRVVTLRQRQKNVKVQKAGIINDKKIEEMVKGYIQLKYSSPPDWH